MVRDRYGRISHPDFVYAYLRKGEILPKEVAYWHGGAGDVTDDGQPGYEQTKAYPHQGWGPETGPSFYAVWHVKDVSIRITSEVRISVPRELYNRIRLPPENEFGMVSL